MVNNPLTGGYISIEQASANISRNGLNVKDNSASQISFQEIYDQKKNIVQSLSEISDNTTLKFSKHADLRLKQRDIILTDEQLNRLSDGTVKAGQKGIKDSLVLMDNLAFIVNTQSKTVVTAMDNTMNDENIFTNIDGAVII